MPTLSPTTLTQAEQRLILRTTAKHPRDHLIISLALGTGLRLGEIVGLNVGDVFNGNGQPRVRVRVRAEIAPQSASPRISVSTFCRPNSFPGLPLAFEPRKPATDFSPLLRLSQRATSRSSPCPARAEARWFVGVRGSSLASTTSPMPMAVRSP